MPKPSIDLEVQEQGRTHTTTPCEEWLKIVSQQLPVLSQGHKEG